MAKLLSDLLSLLADHAASFDETTLSHILRMGVLEAGTKRIPAPTTVLGIWDWDVPNDLAYLDPACARMFGVVARKGVPTSAWKPAIHPDDLPMVNTRIAQALRTGGDYEAEYRVIVNDRPKWILSKGFVTLDKSGRPERFPGAISDLPEMVATRTTLTARSTDGFHC